MQAAVAAGHALTAQAALDTIKMGGNAFDGALAAMMMSCVSEPILASPGGGGYMMARDGSSGDIMFYDFFVQTPAQKRAQETLEFYAAHADFGSVSQEFHIGAGAAAVPGLLPGFFALASDLCRLSSSQLVQPALKAAQDGVEINGFQASLAGVIKPIVSANSEVKAVFLPKGSLPQTGDIHYHQGLAGLFADMAGQETDFCKKGVYAQSIMAQSAAFGGHIARQDLENYQVKTHKPLKIMFQGYEVYLPPPPAAGGVLIAFGLLLLDKLVQEGALKQPDLVDLVQVMEQTHNARTLEQSSILAPTVLQTSAAALQNRKIVSKGTTHISVIDEALNIASLTLTNGEGNGRLVGDYGFMLNNMLGEEDLHPKGFHNWEEGTRLSSMMAPAMIKSPDGCWTALGSGGSNRIRTALLQVIVNLVMRNMSLPEAIGLARIHAEKCGAVNFEYSAALEYFTRQELDAVSTHYPALHKWQERNVFFGGVHAVSGGKGHSFCAAADKRRLGCGLTSE